MGLDMNLYVTEWEIPEIREAFGDDIVSVTRDVGYWRKANAIHNWFVKNVQDGVDNCAEYPVSREQLTALYDTVVSVLANPSSASQLLPTTEGFFFGSTDYDEWYWNSLRHTRDVIGACLEQEYSIWRDYKYLSSW